MYTISGVLCCCQKGKTITLYPGESILIDLKQPHRYYFNKDIPSRIAEAHINGVPAEDIMQYIKKRVGLPVMGEQPEIYEHLLARFEISNQSVRDVFLQSEHCYVILMDFLKETCRSSKKISKRPNIKNFEKKCGIKSFGIFSGMSLWMNWLSLFL